MTKVVRCSDDYRPGFPSGNADTAAFISRDVNQSTLKRHEESVFDTRTELVAFVKKKYRRRADRSALRGFCGMIVCKANLSENQKLSLPFHFSRCVEMS